MIVSPDRHPQKKQILKLLSKRFPRIRTLIIKNMSYEKFKESIVRAKWALTFGEGLDGYFVESIFSGCVSFAVYNDKFFGEDFRNLDTVYSDYATLNK